MEDQKTITEEDLEKFPALKDQGLQVGDPFPVKQEKTPASSEAVLKPGQVIVDADLLKSILAEVEGMREKVGKVDQLERDNEMLQSVADKGRLATWQAKNNPQGLVRTARAWVWKGQLVKATLTLKNQVFTDVNGRVYTDQILKVILADATEHEISYDQFAKEKEYREGDIVKRSTSDENAQTFYTLKFKDGELFEVNYLFIN